MQYLSIRYTERLAEAGIEPSVGSRGDSYDNALAETIIGLYKTELINKKGPWKSLEQVELATLAWVWWFNQKRLLEPIGYIPPAEFEEAFHRQAIQFFDSRITPETIIDYIWYCGLPAFKKGRQWFIYKRDLMDWQIGLIGHFSTKKIGIKGLTPPRHSQYSIASTKHTGSHDRYPKLRLGV